MVLRLLWRGTFGNFFLTSKPYPIYDAEGIGARANLDEGTLAVQTGFGEEAIAIEASFVEGEVLKILETYEAPPEDAVFVEASFTEGEIHQILQTYEGPPEDAVFVEAEFRGGELKRILITYTHPPEEGVFVEASLISGLLI